MFHLSDYAYTLPADRIAQKPCADRSASRLLQVNRQTGQIAHHRFSDVVTLLRPDDLLVVNDTRVIPARLAGRKETGGKVEILIIDYTQGMKNLARTGSFMCDCLIRASKRPKPGTRILLAGRMYARVEAANEAVFQVWFSGKDQFPAFLNAEGRLPLPPYIRQDDPGRGADDATDYQTVYARTSGAVAAPTAGLHFTPELMAALEQKGVEIVRLTLHVGYGTFVPVRVSDIRSHQIHSEYFHVSPEAAARINAARAAGQRVVAVGTTSVRTLEFISDDSGRVTPGSGQCDLFIYPGYQFTCVDAMITNFHLPESTLLMLVSAFYDREKILTVYQAAIENAYRFFSYGDAMLIE